MSTGTSRRDSWDAIAKTKSLLSYGSLESLANLTSNGTTTTTTTTTTNEHSSNNTNYMNNNYGNGNSNVQQQQQQQQQNSSTNYNSTQKFTTSEYGKSQKYTTIESQNGRTHGILKNKNNNHYKSVDAIDAAAHERFSHNGISEYRTVYGKNSLAAGNALEMLPVNKPTSFTLDPGLDANNVTVLVTGNVATLLLIILYNLVQSLYLVSSYTLCR